MLWTNNQPNWRTDRQTALLNALYTRTRISSSLWTYYVLSYFLVIYTASSRLIIYSRDRESSLYTSSLINSERRRWRCRRETQHTNHHTLIYMSSWHLMQCKAPEWRGWFVWCESFGGRWVCSGINVDWIGLKIIRSIYLSHESFQFFKKHPLLSLCIMFVIRKLVKLVSFITLNWHHFLEQYIIFRTDASTPHKSHTNLMRTCVSKYDLRRVYMYMMMPWGVHVVYWKVTHVLSFPFS